MYVYRGPHVVSILVLLKTTEPESEGNWGITSAITYYILKNPKQM